MKDNISDKINIAIFQTNIGDDGLQFFICPLKKQRNIVLYSLNFSSIVIPVKIW